jgi:hypothetical protein
MTAPIDWNDDVAGTLGEEAEAWLQAGAPMRPGPLVIDGNGVRWIMGPEGRYIPLRPAAPRTYRVTEAGVVAEPTLRDSFLSALAWCLPLLLMMGFLIFWSWRP